MKMEQNRTTKGNVRYAEYSVDRMMGLKKIIEGLYDHENQRGKRYAILVDQEIVIGITEDPNLFDKFLEFIDFHTTQVEVRLYYGTSPHHNKHIFRCPQNTLSGVNPSLNSEDEKKVWQLEHELKAYKKKAAKFKVRWQEAEEELEKTTAERDELRELTDMKSMVLEGFKFLKGDNSSKESQLQGTINEAHSEVEIEGINDTKPEVSKAGRLFDKLMQKHRVNNPIDVLEIIEGIITRPDIREKISEMANQK